MVVRTEGTTTLFGLSPVEITQRSMRGDAQDKTAQLFGKPLSTHLLDMSPTISLDSTTLVSSMGQSLL